MARTALPASRMTGGALADLNFAAVSGGRCDASVWQVTLPASSLANYAWPLGGCFAWQACLRVKSALHKSASAQRRLCVCSSSVKSQLCRKAALCKSVCA